MGSTAVLQTSALTLIVNSRRLFPVTLEQYGACGVDISNYRYIVSKGVHAPIAAYEPLGARFVHVNTAGVTGTDLSKFTYHFLRSPSFPFEDARA
jgi:microcystin degradation protein MlrC